MQARGIAPASAADGCPVTRYGHTGYGICGSSVLDVTWADGHTESFVIGTDNAVWHIVSWYSNWASIGGQASDTDSAFYNSSNQPTVRVYVSWAPHKYWCSSIVGSSWSSWYAC
ncbi:hypothetical protein ACFXDJ_15230 [Streptomyces sp. NPDC059443]|uniref:hypothetical protein n=1 Tax=unclassified Streptomyces TaxID=2593676 RepID=UPI0036B4E505